jgi:hypothetical protein
VTGISVHIIREGQQQKVPLELLTQAERAVLMAERPQEGWQLVWPLLRRVNDMQVILETVVKAWGSATEGQPRK